MDRFIRNALAGAAYVAFALLPAVGLAQETDEVLKRRDTAALVSWRAPVSAGDPVAVRILGINDFHGELAAHARAASRDYSRPIGGAAVLAAYLAYERLENPRRTLVLIGGDSIGASPLASGLLRDEPTLAVLNELADGDCPRLVRPAAPASAPLTTRCRMIATPGNHEFDRGTAELERLLYGGAHRDGPVLGREWRGMRIPYLAANVVRRDGQVPLLPASAIAELDGVRIGVIGAVTSETPALVTAGRIPDLNFLAEAISINAEVAKLRARGIATIVLVIHEGLVTPDTPQPAPLAITELSGGLAKVLAGLDGGIDVVVAGHTHKLNNVLVGLRDHSLALVTQARSYGTDYSTIDLTIDRRTGAVVAKSARILTTWADVGPGRKPVGRIERLVAEAVKATRPIDARPVGVAATAIRRTETAAGESALGNLVADAQRAAAGTDFAFMNAGGIRNDLEAGPITYGALFAVHPFGNTILRLTLNGEQVLRLLEQQWSGPHATSPRLLRCAGLRYVYDLRRPAGRRVIGAWDAANQPLDPARRYSVAANDFIVGGGDHYPVLAEGRDPTPVMTDIAALEAWIRRAVAPLSAQFDGRIERADATGP